MYDGLLYTSGWRITLAGYHLRRYRRSLHALLHPEGRPVRAADSGKGDMTGMAGVNLLVLYVPQLSLWLLRLLMP